MTKHKVMVIKNSKGRGKKERKEGGKKERKRGKNLCLIGTRKKLCLIGTAKTGKRSTRKDQRLINHDFIYSQGNGEGGRNLRGQNRWQAA